MAWKHGKPFVGGVDLHKSAAAIALWLGVATAFSCLAATQTPASALVQQQAAVQKNAPAPQSGGASTDDEARSTVLRLLQQALTTHLQLSADDIRKLELNPNTKRVENVNEAIKKCNNNGYEERVRGVLWETAETYCSALGETIEPDLLIDWRHKGLGVDHPAAEAAFARACALPIVNGVREVANGCADLSLLFRDRKQPELALAVVKYAPKCQGTPRAEAEIHPIDPDQSIDSANSQLENCLIQEAQLLREMHRPQEERGVDKALCDAAEETGCHFLAELGAPVNLKAAADRQASLQAAAQSQADADRAARTQARAEHDAGVQALANTIRSLPGGNDPNAIVNTANRQAANMVGLGAATGAAPAPPDAEQFASAKAMNSSSSSSGGAGSESCPNMHQYSDYGAGCNPVRDESSCIRVVSNVWNGAVSELSLVLTNACSSPVRLAVWGPPNGSDPGELQNVGPGQQYPFSSNQQTWHYQADDGVDCFVNNDRPGCSNIGH